MRKELLERRKEMLKLAFRGVSTSKWVRKIAQKYGVNERTIWEDWRRRDEWIGKVYTSNDAVTAAKELLAAKAQTREEAWKVYHNAREKDFNAKIGALKLIDKSAADQVKLLQSLGELEKQLGELGVEKDEKITVNVLPVDEDEDSPRDS